MAISPYLFFDSKCEAAFKFYEQALGGKIEMMLRNEQAPPDFGMPVRPERAKYIMHAQISIDGQLLMASDAPPDRYQKPQGFAVSISVPDVAEAERKFKAISEGGTVGMPFGKTFFSKGFGMCVDKFGISWMVNCPAAGM
jgi:PhnB protein